MDDLTVVGTPVVKGEAINAACATLHASRRWWHRWRWLGNDYCSECWVHAYDALVAATADRTSDREREAIVAEVLWRLDEIEGVESVSSIWDMRSGRLTVKAEFTR